MSNQFIEAINKKAENYAVSRKEIERCSSKGYVFTTEKFYMNNEDAVVIAARLIQQFAIQAVEIFFAARSHRFTVEKVCSHGDAMSVFYNTDQEFEYMDYFTTFSLKAEHIVMRISTYDLPDKHLRIIANNHFVELIGYLAMANILPISHSIPYFGIKVITVANWLELINCDQSEYRLMYSENEDMENDYFELVTVIARNRLGSFIQEIQHGSTRVEAISYIEQGTNEIVWDESPNFDRNSILIYKWGYENVEMRDCLSIFDMNADHVTLAVRLSISDLKSIHKLKTIEEVLQYLRK
jgi:hypothetical protein